jgi:glucose-6-phosphate isomerase
MLDLLTRFPALDAAARHVRLKDSCRIFPGPLSNAIDEHAATAARAAPGVWRRDPSTWSHDPGVQQTIANRLGWLDSPSLMAGSIDRLRSFADGIRRDGFTDVVLLGMGGSSLAPEVLRAILGTASGYPRFQMLDSTDPAAVQAVSTNIERTLYILASKSGGTIEPNALAAHFRRLLEESPVARWSDHFVAITDEGTVLAERARIERFRDIFINPSDIGGRYSALSFFGLVPAALMGHDLEALVGWGIAMLASAAPDVEAATHSGVRLGLAMGAAARAGRDKLTLLTASDLEPFGLWVEQLVAESTGKKGAGVVPIVGEPRGAHDAYGPDRLFVCLHTGDAPECSDSRELEAANLPVISINLPEPSSLGAEFVRWEIATAIAGALLGVNPFDEPNVTQAKDATRALLEEYTKTGQLPVTPPDVVGPNGASFTLSQAARTELDGGRPEQFLELLQPGDYLALLAYLDPDPALAGALRAFRLAVRDGTTAATTFGYGPRYLHSTGQLHKGGPNSGVFILITATPEHDVPVPGEPFSFATLELAQALGDFASLDAAGRRALHIHLPRRDSHALSSVLQRLLL